MRRCSVMSDSLEPHVACQAPLSMEFSMQQWWSGLPFPLQGIFLTQGLNPCLLGFLHWQADSLPLVPLGTPIRNIQRNIQLWLLHFILSEPMLNRRVRYWGPFGTFRQDTKKRQFLFIDVRCEHWKS